jgi:hypothetical protein
LVRRIRVEEAMLRHHLGDSDTAYERETSPLSRRVVTAASKIEACQSSVRI